MTPEEFNFNEFTAPSRLIYLADFLRIPVPTKILRLIPNGNIIGSIVSIGLIPTALEMGIEEKQLINVYTEGKGEDVLKASEHEFRLIIGTMAEETVHHNDKLTITERMEKRVEIAEFVMANRSQLIEYEEVSLGSDIDYNEITLPTFQTGFQPLDMLTGGIAQTLITLMARPGEGKTSTLLTIMGELRRTNVCSSIWYFSLEMPKQMMLYRAKPLLSSIKFKDDDRFFCGQYSPTEVLQMINENPDPDRVIIYDSPDALGGSGERRFVLEEIFRDLVQIKTNSKCVLTASQPRRADGQNLRMDSVAESWQKAWYSDMILTLVDLGRNPHTGLNHLSMATVKNRFGQKGLTVDYQYNYVDLTYQDAPDPTDSSGWSDPNELRVAVGDAPVEW